MQFLKALAAQVLGIGIVVVLTRMIPVPFAAAVALQGVTAAAGSRLLHQQKWWALIHLLFLPAAIALLALHLPPWLYLLAALLLALVFWGTVKGDVPLFLSSSDATEALKEIIDREHAGMLIDLGAGIGSVALPVAQHRPGMTVEAWERAPIPWMITAWRSRRLNNVVVMRRSFWECDLSPYDVVFAFLSPAAMRQLGEKVRHEMHAGSLFVSSSFPVPGWEPETIAQLKDSMATKLYCYRIQDEHR